MWCEQLHIGCLLYGYVQLVRSMAILAMGLAVILVLPRSREIPLGWSFRYVGAFAVSHGTSLLIGLLQAWDIASSPALEPARAALRLIAAALLLQFGCYVLSRRPHPASRWLRRLPIAAGFVAGIAIIGDAAARGHLDAEFARWITYGVVFLPGMALAAAAFWRIHHEMAAVGLQVPERDARWVAIAIIAEAIIVSGITLSAAMLPWRQLPWAAWIITMAETLRPVATIALAAAVIQFLRLFDLARERRMEAMARERQEALQRAEEAQLRLEQEIARWSTQLEALTRRRPPQNSGRSLERWRESVEAVSVARERERISQELHDGIAQLLGYLHLRAQAAQQALLSGRTSEASLTLQQIERLAETAYAEVREAILGLRLASFPDVEEAILQYLAYFQERWRIEADWHVQDRRALSLSPLVELQMLRVIQEALTNVRKHAQATHVRLTLTVEGEEALLVIQDDGIGFDPEDIRLGHFGLRLMRERCESVGGRFCVKSAPGQGTRIEVRLPMRRASRAKEVHHEADPGADRR